jgi:hypothetical protein
MKRSLGLTTVAATLLSVAGTAVCTAAETSVGTSIGTSIGTSVESQPQTRIETTVGSGLGPLERVDRNGRPVTDENNGRAVIDEEQPNRPGQSNCDSYRNLTVVPADCAPRQ